MTIKNLKKFLEKQAPSLFFDLSIQALKGKRIAIDGHYWMYNTLASATSIIVKETNVAVEDPSEKKILNRWLQSSFTMIDFFLKNGVGIVFVFDGIHELPEKTETRQKRRDDREKTKKKANILKEKIRNEDPLLVKEKDVFELKKLMAQAISLPQDYFELYKRVIYAAGIPCLQAKTEGEKLCSMLCREGKVSAVFSSDSDNIAYGCPLIINEYKIGYPYSDSVLHCIKADQVAEALKMTQAQFLDLCIMAGCDYNNNIPQKGVSRAFKLIQDHGSIDALSDKLDIACLKHQRCRELLSPDLSDDLIDEVMFEYSLDLNPSRLVDARVIFQDAGVEGQLNYFADLYKLLKNNGYQTTGGLLKLNITPAVRAKAKFSFDSDEE